MKDLFHDSRIKMFVAPGVNLTALRASGNKIDTEEYGELIDFQSGCWAAVLGHSNREVTKTIVENISLLLHTHQFFDTEHPGTLVNQIRSAAHLQSHYKGTFLSSGSEAVSLAVLLAEVITGRKRKLSLSISYHGASADLRMPRNTQLWTDLDVAQCLSCKKSMNCKECGKFSYVDFYQMAAFVFEAGNSGGLVLCPPQKLIAYLAEEVRAAGGYVIANEVTTGFGRTGKWFGFQHYDFLNSESTTPDFIAMGKGLGNGYPVSGLLIRPSLAGIIESTGLRYVQSHTDDPMGCIVAKRVIDIIVKENLIERGNEMGNHLRKRLKDVSEATGGIKEIRGRGIMNIVVLNNSHKAVEVFKRLLQEGSFTGFSEFYNYIHLYPPLTIGIEEIDSLCNSLEQILQIKAELDLLGSKE